MGAEISASDQAHFVTLLIYCFIYCLSLNILFFHQRDVLLPNFCQIPNSSALDGKFSVYTLSNLVPATYVRAVLARVQKKAVINFLFELSKIYCHIHPPPKKKKKKTKQTNQQQKTDTTNNNN